jgi:hypothetical protein
MIAQACLGVPHPVSCLKRGASNRGKTHRHFTEDQVIGTLNEQKRAFTRAEICRKHNISLATCPNGKRNRQAWQYPPSVRVVAASIKLHQWGRAREVGMARYGHAFKNKVVAQLLPPNTASIEGISREVSVSAETLER